VVKDLSPTAVESLRRSVVMLAPRHPAALDREAAIEILSELQRLQRRSRRLDGLIDQVRALLAEDEDS
jgi:hypothetical protein